MLPKYSEVLDENIFTKDIKIPLESLFITKKVKDHQIQKQSQEIYIIASQSREELHGSMVALIILDSVAIGIQQSGFWAWSTSDKAERIKFISSYKI